MVLPWVALVPLVLLLDAPRAGGWGWLHGIVSWLAAIPWIVPTLTTFGALPKALAWLALVLLAAYLGLFHGAFAALGRLLWRRGGWALWVGLPSLWVTLEVVRAHLLSGFPWNLAAYAWVEVPGALPLAAWIGAYGVSGLVLLANTGLARGLLRRQPAPALVGVLVPLLALAVGGRWGEGRPQRPVELRARPVAIVQPNIPNQTVYDPRQTLEGYRRLLGMSSRVCAPGGLVIWPESASWPFILGRDPVLAEDVGALTAAGCGLLLNSIALGSEGDFNSVYLVRDGAPVARYDKRHLVPFGEYVPLAGIFPFLDKLARHAGDFTAAREVRLLPWNGEQLGVMICFEAVFAAEAAQLVQAGATLLVTVTNDAWYGDTAAPWQHLRAARFRAAENRRLVLRAAITGVSAVIRPDGSVRSLLAPFEEGTIEARAVGRTDLSPASRWPWLVPWVACLATALAILAPWRKRP